MDISITKSPKRGGDVISGCDACNQHYCNRAAPDKSPYMVFARSFLLLLMGFPPLQPIGQKRSHCRASSQLQQWDEPAAPSSSSPGLVCGAQVLEVCGGHVWAGAADWRQRPWATMGQAPGQTCWQKLLPRMPVASCGAPGPFRALNPQHYERSGKSGIFVCGWVFFEPVSFTFSSFFPRPQQLKLHFLFNLLTKAGHLSSKTGIWIPLCPWPVSPFSISSSSSSCTTPQHSNLGIFMLELLELAAVY